MTRVFSVAGDLHVFLQSYPRGATTMRPPVTFVASIRGDDKVFESAPLAVVGGMHPKSKAIPMRTTVSLRALRPSRYECQVTVVDPETQKAGFWRAPIVLAP